MENMNVNAQTAAVLPVITDKTTLGELLAMLGLTVGQKRTGKTPKRATLLVEAGVPIAEKPRIKVFRNGYALYENGYGKYSVLWLPYCTHFTYHFNKLRDAEKDYLKENYDLPDGMFDDELAAASAYNAYVRKLWGEYAVLNDIVEVDYRQKRYFRKSANPQSRFLGVSKHKNGKWTARLTMNGKRVTIGYFNSEEEAAEAYNKAYVAYTGKEAPNVIE